MPDPSKSKGHKVAMPSGAIPQHKRLAAGEKVTGMGSNPNGSVSKEKKIGNAKATH